MKAKINQLIVKAMKSKDAVSLKVLKVVKGEIETAEKRNNVTLSDAEILKIISKMVESITESNGPQEEIDVLTPFIPVQLTDDELSEHITNFIEANSLSGMKEMKTVMGFLQTNFGGRYDGKLASDLIKAKLTA